MPAVNARPLVASMANLSNSNHARVVSPRSLRQVRGPRDFSIVNSPWDFHTSRSIAGRTFSGRAPERRIHMSSQTEPNAQNSEFDPQAHPSGSRIEKMMQKQNNSTSEQSTTPRPRTRESLPTDEPAEGGRDQLSETSSESHRRSPNTRET